MKDFWDKTFYDDKGRLKQGHEYHVLYNLYNAAETGVILRWHNGKLHDDGTLPAVEFQDAHIEHYRNGLLHNELPGPAIVSQYGAQREYYLNGEQHAE